jgi:hypothetical protein
VAVLWPASSASNESSTALPRSFSIRKRVKDSSAYPGRDGWNPRETAGRNPRRQWNAALHAQLTQGGDTGFFDFINGLYLESIYKVMSLNSENGALL